MEVLVANLVGALRREQVDGRDFLVAPMTMIVPGVLNGSRGPGLYELNDIQASMDAWNDMPVLVNHPTVESGKSLSARHPKVWAKQGIGRVYNASVNGKLTAEAWIDVEKARKVNAGILNAIERGQPVELSTGLNVDVEPKEGVYNGQSYTGVFRNFRPDHLAVLTSGSGACAVKDGCGVNNDDRVSLLTKLAQLLGIGTPAVTNKEPNMGMTTEQRGAIVGELITNCACTGFKEEDREALNKLDDKVLTNMKGTLDKHKQTENKIKEQELVVNAAKAGVEILGTQFSVNEKGEWVNNKKAKNQDDEEEEDEEEDVKKKKGKAVPATNENADQRLTTEEREAIAFANKVRNERKQNIVKQLVTNIKDEAKKLEHAKELMAMNDQQLLKELERHPVANTEPEFDFLTRETGPAFYGASGPAHNQNTKKPDPIPESVYNWDAMAAGLMKQEYKDN